MESDTNSDSNSCKTDNSEVNIVQNELPIEIFNLQSHSIYQLIHTILLLNPLDVTTSPDNNIVIQTKTKKIIITNSTPDKARKLIHSVNSFVRKHSATYINTLYKQYRIKKSNYSKQRYTEHLEISNEICLSICLAHKIVNLELTKQIKSYKVYCMALITDTWIVLGTSAGIQYLNITNEEGSTHYKLSNFSLLKKSNNSIYYIHKINEQYLAATCFSYLNVFKYDKTDTSSRPIFVCKKSFERNEKCLFTFPMSSYFFGCASNYQKIYWFTFDNDQLNVVDSVFTGITLGWVGEYQPDRLLIIEKFSKCFMENVLGVACNYDVQEKKAKWKIQGVYCLGTFSVCAIGNDRYLAGGHRRVSVLTVTDTPSAINITVQKDVELGEFCTVCPFDEHTFIYSYNQFVYQMTNRCTIAFSNKWENTFNGEQIIMANNNQNILVLDDKCNIYLFRVGTQKQIEFLSY